MNPYKLAKERIPAKSRFDQPREFPVKPFQEGFPSVGFDIGKAIVLSGKKVPLKLTEAQYKNLRDVVVLPDGRVCAPPDVMKQSHPAEWDKFIDNLIYMPWFNHQNVTVGNIIKAMRGYHWMGGWLTYKPNFEATEDINLDELGL